MDQKFSKWFHENSAYALHRTPKRKFSTILCCTKQPQETGKRIWFPHPDSGTMEPFALFRCEQCGKYYVQYKEAFCLVEPLLKYQILP